MFHSEWKGGAGVENILIWVQAERLFSILKKPHIF
jgi:hypothetical protein